MTRRAYRKQYDCILFPPFSWVFVLRPEDPADICRRSVPFLDGRLCFLLDAEDDMLWQRKCLRLTPNALLDLEESVTSSLQF